MIKRTKLADRQLPDYTRGEEIFNMVTHIIGGGFGIIALVACVLMAAFRGDAIRIVSGAIYGASMIALYTMSSIYHGLKPIKAKKIFQVIDHCSIFFLIAGTYTPLTLGPLRDHAPVTAWVVFGIEWAFTALGVTFNAIDLKKYKVFSMICYLGMGWAIVFAGKPMIEAMAFEGLMWLLAGGIAYTVGAVLYGVGKKVRYMHSVFHIFVLLGSVLQFVSVLLYAMIK